MDLAKRLRQNNKRFLLSISSILERYNQPFEDDLLISMETLTYDTVDGPKPWVQVSTKQLKEWKQKVFKQPKRRIHRNAESQNCFGWKRPFRLLSPNVLQLCQVALNHVPQHHISATEMSKQETSDFKYGHSTVHEESPEISAMETSDIDEENDTSVALVSRKYEDTHSQNLFGHDGKIPEIVKVDSIVQDDARRIPKWMMVAPQASSIDLPLALPVQELSANTITTLRHPPHPELHKTCCDSILEDDQSGAEEYSWSNLTLADLYPVIVEIFKKRMTKHSRKKELKYMFGRLRYRRWYSRTSKLKVIVDKRGFRPLKMKQALPSICSSRSENIQNKTFESENRELCEGSCSINDFSALVSCIDTNGNKVNYRDSSSEQHLVFRKSQKASQQPLDHIVRMGETFLAEDKLQTASLENSKCKQSENLAYKCSSECNFIASAASSGSAVVHLVNKSNTQHDLPCGDTSELCSSPYSSYDNSNTSKCFTSCCIARTSNALLVGPKKVISTGKISFQCRNSFSSLSMKQRPSEIAQKYEDAFETLYHELSSKEIPKPLMLTRPHSNSQNSEEEGRLVKSNFSVSMKSETEFDRAFDRIYEQLCSEPIPKLPGLQRVLTYSRYEEIQIPKPVNALVNSPVQASSQLLGVKRQGNFQSYLCSKVKRVRNVPECSWPSPKRQQASHGRNIHMRTVGMDFLSTHNSSNPSFSASHTCQSQHSGFQASTDKIHPCLPGTSLQESGISGAHSSLPKGKEVLTTVPKFQGRLTEEYPEN